MCIYTDEFNSINICVYVCTYMYVYTYHNYTFVHVHIYLHIHTIHLHVHTLTHMLVSSLCIFIVGICTNMGLEWIYTISYTKTSDIAYTHNYYYTYKHICIYKYIHSNEHGVHIHNFIQKKLWPLMQVVEDQWNAS